MLARVSFPSSDDLFERGYFAELGSGPRQHSSFHALSICRAPEQALSNLGADPAA